MKFNSMKENFSGASAEAQVKYLQQCLRIQHNKNSSLLMQIETQKMEAHFETKALADRYGELKKIIEKQREELVLLRKSPLPMDSPKPKFRFEWIHGFFAVWIPLGVYFLWKIIHS